MIFVGPFFRFRRFGPAADRPPVSFSGNGTNGETSSQPFLGAETLLLLRKNGGEAVGVRRFFRENLAAGIGMGSANSPSGGEFSGNIADQFHLPEGIT